MYRNNLMLISLLMALYIPVSLAGFVPMDFDADFPHYEIIEDIINGPLPGGNLDSGYVTNTALTDGESYLYRITNSNTDGIVLKYFDLHPFTGITSYNVTNSHVFIRSF